MTIAERLSPVKDTADLIMPGEPSTWPIEWLFVIAVLLTAFITCNGPYYLARVVIGWVNLFVGHKEKGE